jgi:hypothetical protein
VLKAKRISFAYILYTKMANIKKYKLYALDHYAQTNEFAKNDFKEFFIEDLVSELETNNNGYHMRIISTENYIFFGDCDHFDGNFESFCDMLIDFLIIHYDIKVALKDISYTQNEAMNGSFHYSIPKYYASCKKLKEIHTKFYQKHEDVFCKKVDGKTQKVVDTTVYTTKWFRYPLQHKAKAKKTRHIIQHGEMIDFVVENIPKKSECIDDKEYIDVLPKGTKKTLKIVKKRDHNTKKVVLEKQNKNSGTAIEKFKNTAVKTKKTEKIENVSIRNEKTKKVSTRIEKTKKTKKSVKNIKNDKEYIDDNANNDDDDDDDVNNNDDDDDGNDDDDDDDDDDDNDDDDDDDGNNDDDGNAKSFFVESLDENDNDDGKRNNKNALCERIHSFKKNITQQFKEELLKNILNAYSKKINDDYESWRTIGMALRNESSHFWEFFKLWDDFSRKGEKYDGTQSNKKKWSSFTTTKGGYTVKHLLDLLMKDNIKEFNRLNEFINFNKIIIDTGIGMPEKQLDSSIKNTKDEDDKDNEIDDNFRIEQMHRKNDRLEATFEKRVCPFIGKKHIDTKSKTCAELNLSGIICLKCTDKICHGKMCPEGGQVVPKEYYSQIFVNNNINICVNGGNKTYSIKEILDSDTKILKNTKLNGLVIKSLYNEEIAITEAIIIVNKDKFCCEDAVWYYFNNNYWKKCDNADKLIITNYTALFHDVKIFIKKKQLNAMVRYEYIDQIDKFIEKVSKPKMRKEYIKTVQDSFTNKKRFDTDFNLFGFSNGVYDFDKMIFRQAEPKDMVKMSCGYDFCKDYKNKQLLLNILSNIFPTEESKKFFLMCIALAMCGKNIDFIELIRWKKHIQRDCLSELLLTTFGEYSCEYDDLSKINAENGSVITTDLSGLKTTRLVIIEDAKQISRNNVARIVNRKILKYQKKKKDKEVKINFFTVCMCENDPVIGDDDKKKVVKITTLDNDDVPINLNSVGCDFFLLLLEQMKDLKKRNFLIDMSLLNKQIDDENKHDKNDNEKSEDEKIIQTFFENCCEKTKECRVISKDAYDRYVKWCGEKNIDEYSNKRFVKIMRNIDEDIKYFESIKINKKTHTGFSGFKLKD